MTLTSEPAKAIDPHALRADFPILGTTVHGKPLVYLDSASTTPEAAGRHRRARRATTASYNANVHRGIYEIGERGDRGLRGRARAGRAVHRRVGLAPGDHLHPRTRPRRSTSSPTRGAASESARGDVIVLTEMEHHANLVPWQLLVQEKDGDARFIPITDDGVLRLDVLRGAAHAQAEARRVHRTSRTCSARSTRSTEIARHAPTTPARSCWSTGRRPCPTCRSTSRRSAATSSRSPATRCSAPTGSASCGRAASCSRRCRRSWAAAR